MALVNQAKREINAKIVFFGPEGAGKGTTLKHVHSKVKPEFRGAMKGMDVQQARMLFFDFTPPADGGLQGFKIRIHVYTLSGRVADPASWKMVLKGADGIVFVADSDPGRLEANRESLAALGAYLKGFGETAPSTPLVFQFNKSDLPQALPAAELDRLLNPAGTPGFRTSSQSGQGVLQTLLTLVKTVLTGFKAKGAEGVASGEVLQRVLQNAASSQAAYLGEAGEQGPAEGPAAAQPAERAESAGTCDAGGAAAQEPTPPEPSFTFGAPQPGPFPRAGVAAAEPVTGLELDIEEQWLAAGREEPARPGEEALSLEIASSPEAAAPGVVRVPVTIRAGSRARTVVLRLAVSLEEG